MTPLVAAFVTIVAPMLLWLYTLSEAQRLPRGNDASRGARLAGFIMKHWPFLLMPIVLPYCISHLGAAELAMSSSLNIAMMVSGLTLLLSWMFRTTKA
ncbi:hypothetical protein [Novosphingobium sp. AP12]|uniref:hypothetical protein n=1 Tax=Novosphingobium sp. AP12 TaxID=1144305 RepID=UPI000271DE1A|nr:hypothetical protein [Novosphingobium sp. AP12]EJL20426.1 hypothetical protein PMI02_05545 [Novosphingobium sp. AP12]